MKKSQIILIGLLILGLNLSGCKQLEKLINTETTTTETTTKTVNELDEVLKEENISSLAEIKVEADTDDYIIFIYSPTCPHCHNVLNSSEYESFVENANIKLYLISTYKLSDNFFEQTGIKHIPTMILIDKITEDNYEVTNYVGDSDCIDLIVQFTNSNSKE